MEKHNYYYIGVMITPVASDRFLTSLFKNEDGLFFTQVDKNERIVDFQETFISRELVLAEEQVLTKLNDEKIYSFMTSKKRLIYGTRQEVEADLLPLLHDIELTVQANY